MTSLESLAAAYKSACLTELEALKPGNVHIFADGHGMVVGDFIRSAEASAPAITATGLSVGQRIFSAIEASWKVADCNTNLGIVLLCAPVIHAVLTGRQGSLRENLAEVLRVLTIDDATFTFRGIIKASPAGLGQGMEHDVHASPSVTLLAAMQQAQARDLIARQYANDYADIFDFGVERYRECVLRWKHETWAVSAVYLGFLARFPDSHIVRKYGQAVALGVQQEALAHEQALLESENPKNCQRELLKFDADLKRRGLNPGTSADLTVASLLIVSLDSR
jgi:triphosphoribosyl-dephospho-CoA synthase